MAHSQSKRQSKKSKTIYKIVEGSCIKRSLAQVLGEELAEIQKRRGTLTAEIVVEEAMRNPSGVLHSQLEWDNKTAAKKWRIEQAQRIIRSIEVKIDKHHVYRAFLNVPVGSNGGTRHYEPAKSALSNKVSRDFLLQMALRELSYLKHKYAALKELAKVFEAIDRVSRRRKS